MESTELMQTNSNSLEKELLWLPLCDDLTAAQCALAYVVDEYNDLKRTCKFDN
ncbi:hypothetical protein DAPPUDRAFT_234229 [Daphnia pulex]|uniref:Uncharacterized protein n=1 Tax=Daphnia pulex TaxID=6669 RepID=E9FUX2_DAPPU|nr:hypothetical protein DAPPUDRAFT_234229 [Daphnia pulex]|eukprot:EFX88796.1 hypothetical protein DAPPUDRAFT_234229 [Daphnia pulex]